MPIFNRNGLSELKERADGFSGSIDAEMQEIDTFYRNKPAGYFEEIDVTYANIMYPYRKDRNGDQYCPANERIRGLFFHGLRAIKKGKQSLPSGFLFGDTRVIVPVSTILDAESNLYFCDFWCHTNEHHVTIVVTKQGSPADWFCQEYLLSLNRRCNGYLDYDSRTGSVSINPNLWVEVFYTEAVDLEAAGIRWASGRCIGVSRPGGKSKRTDCDICNLRVHSSHLRPSPPVLEPDEMSGNRVPILPEHIVDNPDFTSEYTDPEEEGLHLQSLYEPQNASIYSYTSDTFDREENSKDSANLESLYEPQNAPIYSHTSDTLDREENSKDSANLKILHELEKATIDANTVDDKNRKAKTTDSLNLDASQGPKNEPVEAGRSDENTKRESPQNEIESTDNESESTNPPKKNKYQKTNSAKHKDIWCTLETPLTSFWNQSTIPNIYTDLWSTVNSPLFSMPQKITIPSRDPIPLPWKQEVPKPEPTSKPVKQEDSSSEPAKKKHRRSLEIITEINFPSKV